MAYRSIEDKIASREVKIEEIVKKLDLLYQTKDIEGFSNNVAIAQLELIISEVQLELDNLYILENLLEVTSTYS
jgi:hypothetical protein